VLSGADFNQILGVVFGTEPLMKRPRTRVSPNKPLNPQPLASVTPCTHTTVKATTIIDIQDDLEPETLLSTFFTEHPPSPPPPQSPNLATTSPPQTTTPEPMQLDHPEIVEQGLPGITQESPKPTSEVSGPDPKASEPSMKLNDLNLDTQEQKPESSAQEKDARTREEPEVERNQQITSPAKGEGAQEIKAHEAKAPEEPKIPDAQNELESTTG
jgi:hypothetical protein